MTRLFVHCPLSNRRSFSRPRPGKFIKENSLKTMLRIQIQLAPQIEKYWQQLRVFIFSILRQKRTRGPNTLLLLLHSLAAVVTSFAAASRPVNRIDHLEQCSITRFVRNHFDCYCMQQSVSTLTYVFCIYVHTERTNRLNVSLTARAPVKQGFD